MDLKDPALYRVLSLLFVPARSSDEQIAAAAQNLTVALNYFATTASLPPSKPLNSPKQLAWQRHTLWNTDWSQSPTNGLNISAFAQTRHSDGILMLAVEEDGLQDYENWLKSAPQSSEQVFGKETDWRKFFTFPGDEFVDGRVRVTGQAWLATAEWETKPAQGWADYVQRCYRRNSYLLFPWGFLGYRPAADKDDSPLFELHVEASATEERDNFLYGGMPLLLIDYLKVSQFMWERYRKHMAPRISNLERQLLSRIETIEDQRVTPNLRTTEDSVRDVSKLLHEYSLSLAALSEDVHTIGTDCIAVADTLKAAGLSSEATAQSSMLSNMKRIQNQLASDLEYFKITNQQGDRCLQTLQVLVDIERARNENRLIIIGIILATLIGLTQLLPDKYPRVPNQYGGLVRVVISIVLCAIAIGLYYWRQGAGKSGKR